MKGFCLFFVLCLQPFPQINLFLNYYFTDLKGLSLSHLQENVCEDCNKIRQNRVNFYTARRVLSSHFFSIQLNVNIPCSLKQIEE